MITDVINRGDMGMGGGKGGDWGMDPYGMGGPPGWGGPPAWAAPPSRYYVMSYDVILYDSETS